MPPNGNPHDANCAIALAFGRNTFDDAELFLIRKTLDHTFKGDAYTMIDWLDDEHFDPGRPNEEIAIFAESALTDHLSVAVQWEVAIAISRGIRGNLFADMIKQEQLKVLWPRPNEPFYRSYQVLEDAAINLPSSCKPLLLCHDLHAPRVFMIARNMGMQPIIGHRSITNKFDRNSVQRCTASRKYWYAYEAMGRVHHVMHGLV